MRTYRKKPVVIEATQYDGSPENASDIIDWALAYDTIIRFVCSDERGNVLGRENIERCNGQHVLLVQTLEGDMVAKEGDYIIRGVQHEFYPCRGDIFEQTYEEVTDA